MDGALSVATNQKFIASCKGEIMPDTAVNFVDVQLRRSVLRVAPELPRHVGRGRPLPGAANADAVVKRVSNAAQLDVAMRHQLVRILTTTVQDWTRQ